MKVQGMRYGSIVMDKLKSWKSMRLKYTCNILDSYRKPITADKRNQDADVLYDYYGASGAIDKIDGYTIDDHVMLMGEDGANLILRNLPLMYEVHGKAWINNHAHILKPKSGFDFKFLMFAFENADIFTYVTGSAQPKLCQEKMKEIRVLVPPLDDQKRIAAFLDSKCSEIDALSADIQKEIETLEQYKRSVITEAVTKGLNPDVETKDSGIEWVGNIPAHWDVRPLYYYFAERKKKNYLGQEQNLLSLSYGKVIRKDINTSEGLLPDSFNGYNIIEPGDIVLRLTDLQNDKRSLRTGLVKEHGIITSAYVTLKAAKEVVPEYFHYLLHAYDVMKVLYNMGNGVRQGLNYSELSKMHIVAPPIDEQKNIAAYLDAKCKEIESIIESKKQQLTVIDSYKKSLIYEYVTGKKEVI